MPIVYILLGHVALFNEFLMLYLNYLTLDLEKRDFCSDENTLKFHRVEAVVTFTQNYLRHDVKTLRRLFIIYNVYSSG